MKIYLDTANLGEIREAARWGILSGVTTNPSLMAQEEGADFEDTIRTICELVNGPISAETVSEDADGMVREGVEFAGWHSNVIIKVPSTTEGLEAVSRLGRRSIRCNVTLIFNTNQALLAALAGAFVVSPFIGRVDDMSYDGMELRGKILTTLSRGRIVFEAGRVIGENGGRFVRPDGPPQHVSQTQGAG